MSTMSFFPTPDEIDAELHRAACRQVVLKAAMILAACDRPPEFASGFEVIGADEVLCWKSTGKSASEYTLLEYEKVLACLFLGKAPEDLRLPDLLYYLLPGNPDFRDEEDEAVSYQEASILLGPYSEPVPVNQRLPAASDCLGRPTDDSDAGWCWGFSQIFNVWSFAPVVFPRPHPHPPRTTVPQDWSHWLPYNALPLPRETE